VGEGAADDAVNPRQIGRQAIFRSARLMHTSPTRMTTTPTLSAQARQAMWQPG
jgi:hypothetical protein